MASPAHDLGPAPALTLLTEHQRNETLMRTSNTTPIPIFLLENKPKFSESLILFQLEDLISLHNSSEN